MVDYAERIPALSDAELKNLHNNALRLLESGTPAQKIAAEGIIPLTQAAMAERKAAALAAKPKPSGVRKKAIKKVAAPTPETEAV
jgi:hypothetical protein